MEKYPSNILNQIKVANVNRMLDQVERETAFVKLGWVIKDTMSRRQAHGLQVIVLLIQKVS